MLLHHLRLHHPRTIAMSLAAAAAAAATPAPAPAPAPARINVLSSHVHTMAMANNNIHDTPPLSSPSEPAYSTRPAHPHQTALLSARCTITYTVTRPSLVRTRLAAGKDDQFPPILQAGFTSSCRPLSSPAPATPFASAHGHFPSQSSPGLWLADSAERLHGGSPAAKPYVDPRHWFRHL